MNIKHIRKYIKEFPIVGHYKTPPLSFQYRVVGCRCKSDWDGKIIQEIEGHTYSVIFDIEVWDIVRNGYELNPPFMDRSEIMMVNKFIRNSSYFVEGSLHDNLHSVLVLFSLEYLEIGEIKHIGNEY